MLQSNYEDNNLSEKLKIFSSGLGGIFNELLKSIGSKMTSEAKGNAPRRTGKLANSINFLLFEDNAVALTTKKRITSSNVWYSNVREHGANIQAKKSDYLMFKINGEWKKVKSVKTAAQPFAKPVFNDYFGDNGKCYAELQNALLERMEREI